MRLINTASLELKEFFNASQVPPYAILSHCWGENEVSFKEYVGTPERARAGPGWKKIIDCCSIARRDSLDWAWVDTCCIDKSSTAELQEAINSMYRWYERASVCYAFLGDFDINETPPGDSDSLGSSADSARALASSEAVWSRFSDCRWFTRGWTLQELIAPKDIFFYDCNGTLFGSKKTLVEKLTRITGIGSDYLLKSTHPTAASISCRMSWASDRTTTREEDLAYCLLGIFDINLPLMYGEGERAFIRLQEAIIETNDDQSIYAWAAEDGSRDHDSGTMLAHCPSEFYYSGSITPIKDDRPPARLTSRGLELYYPYRGWSGLWHILMDAVLGYNPSRIAPKRLRFPLACTCFSYSQFCRCLQCSNPGRPGTVEIELAWPSSPFARDGPDHPVYWREPLSVPQGGPHSPGLTPRIIRRMGEVLFSGFVALVPPSKRCSTIRVERIRGRQHLIQSSSLQGELRLNASLQGVWWLSFSGPSETMRRLLATAFSVILFNALAYAFAGWPSSKYGTVFEAVTVWLILTWGLWIAPVKIPYLLLSTLGYVMYFLAKRSASS